MKKELLQAMLGDELLVGMVGRLKAGDGSEGEIPCIFYNTPLSWDTFPAVAFYEKSGGDAVFADDVCIAKTIFMQVDIYANEGMAGIYERVDFDMRSLGYNCDSACDMPDANIGHIQLVYKKIIDA